jgi:DUF971 family protein
MRRAALRCAEQLADLARERVQSLQCFLRLDHPLQPREQLNLLQRGRVAVRPLSIDSVGRYAIRFHWSDGHSTGIYTFEHLRELCPCPICADNMYDRI